MVGVSALFLGAWMARHALGLGLAALGLLALLAAGPAGAATQALDDDALAGVSGAGISLSGHLVLNGGLLDGQPLRPNLQAGFQNDGVTTWLVLHGLGGVMDWHTLTLNVRTRANGSDYLDIGLPQSVAFDQFGFRALAAQADPNAPVAAHYGGLLLNGTLQMQGHVYLWAR